MKTGTAIVIVAVIVAVGVAVYFVMNGKAAEAANSEPEAPPLPTVNPITGAVITNELEAVIAEGQVQIHVAKEKAKSEIEAQAEIDKIAADAQAAEDARKAEQAEKDRIKREKARINGLIQSEKSRLRAFETTEAQTRVPYNQKRAAGPPKKGKDRRRYEDGLTALANKINKYRALQATSRERIEELEADLRKV